MQIQFRHQTIYLYDQDVTLQPHVIRLTPRQDLSLRILSHEVTLDPEPAGRSDYLDANGNAVCRVWFTRPTRRLAVTSAGEVITLRANPFDYLPDPDATTLPLQQQEPLGSSLSPFLIVDPGGESEVLRHAAEDFAGEVDHQTLPFLDRINQALFDRVTVRTREAGHPHDPLATWETGRGACRDVAMLFIEFCRMLGVPARFVSGYFEGTDDDGEHHLHAWPEVYIPGGGWRGYDPTLGLSVADRHIPLAAGAVPISTLPIEGAFFAGDGKSRMETTLQVRSVPFDKGS